MYNIVEQYACGHEQKFKTSKDTYKQCHTTSNHRQFLLKKPAYEGIFSKMFRRSFSSTRYGDLPARFKQISDICQQCKGREAENQARAGTLQQVPYNLAEVRAQQVLRATKTLRAGKEQFQCSKCMAEGRALVYLAQRAANDGLCCENGRMEWDRSQALHPNGHSQLARANSQPVHLSPTTAAARQAADQASSGYGWDRDQPLPGRSNTMQEDRHITAVGYDPRRARVQIINRDSTHLEPRLAQELGSLPGYALPSPPTQKPEQGTYYREPGIDFARWDKHPRTNHGRIPAAPKALLPLPPPPRTAQPGRDLIRRKPVPQTPQSHSRPSQSTGSSSSQLSLQRTPPQQPAKPLTGTCPPRSHVFPPTPPKTPQHSSSSRRQPPPPLKAHFSTESTPGRRKLRTTRGRDWHDSANLAAKSPPTTPVTNTRPQHQQPRMQEQDIASVSRLKEPFSPGIPMNESIFKEWKDDVSGVPPLPFGENKHQGQASSSRQQERVREERALSNQSNINLLLDETLREAEHWGHSMKKTPSRRRR